VAVWLGQDVLDAIAGLCRELRATTVHALWVKARRRSVSIDPAEIAGLTGLPIDQVQTAFTALENTGQLQREPSRAGATFTRYSPVV
jgi:hypothetical protein